MELKFRPAYVYSHADSLCSSRCEFLKTSDTICSAYQAEKSGAQLNLQAVHLLPEHGPMSMAHLREFVSIAVDALRRLEEEAKEQLLQAVVICGERAMVSASAASTFEQVFAEIKALPEPHLAKALRKLRCYATSQNRQSQLNAEAFTRPSAMLHGITDVANDAPMRETLSPALGSGDRKALLLNAFQYWNEHKSLSCFSHMFGAGRPPKFKTSDQDAWVHLAAYFHQNLAETLELSAILSDETEVTEKLQIVLQIRPDDKLDDVNSLSFVRTLSLLIADIFAQRNKVAEKLLLVSTGLKLSLKHIFRHCAPELFFRLLSVGGGMIRNGSDMSEIYDYFLIFQDDVFQRFSKAFVNLFLTEVHNEASKALSSVLIDSMYSFVIFVKFTSSPLFYALLNPILAALTRARLEYGDTVEVHIRTTLEKMATECLNLDKFVHLAATLQIIQRLSLFGDIVQGNLRIKSKFSTLGALPLFDLLCRPALDPATGEDAGQIFKTCSQLLSNPKQPLNRLALTGLHSILDFSIARRDDSLSVRVRDYIMERCDLVALFPYQLDLQSIVEKTRNLLKRSDAVPFFSALYLRVCAQGTLADLLLIFVSGLIERAECHQKPNSLRAFEYSLDRLVYLCQGESSKVFQAYVGIVIEPPHDLADWDTIASALVEIPDPTTFSEWIFTVYSRTLSYCKAKEGELFRALLPAVLADPFCVLPIFPVLFAVACVSGVDGFMTRYLKAEILVLVNTARFPAYVIETILDALNETFNIFSSLGNSSVSETSEYPNWLNQFNPNELMLLFTHTRDAGMLKYASFFMQLVWTVDRQRLESVSIHGIFTQLNDYKSALSVFSTEDAFDTERSVYHFLAMGHNNLAEAGIKMLMTDKHDKFDGLFLRNNALRMDKEVFEYHYETLSRIAPQRRAAFNHVLLESNLTRHLQCQFRTAPLVIDYEIETANRLMLRGGADSTQKWDNFQLLKEAKTLRRSKDFENSYYILSKMHLGNDPFVSFKHFLELGNWFHCSGRFGAAIEIFNSLIREQKNPQLLAKIHRKLALSMAASRHFIDQEIVEVFERSVSFDRMCAKTYFELACFYDSRSEKHTEKSAIILKNLARTLLNSRSFDHLAYPRFITIWLNGYSDVINADKKVGELVLKFIGLASTAQAVNHLSQLISRVGHPNTADFALIEQLFIKIAIDFPDAALWKVCGVANSVNEVRKMRVVHMLAKLKTREKNVDIKSFLDFSNLLVLICDMAAPSDIIKLSLVKEVQNCTRILASNASIAAPNSALIYCPENKEDYDYIEGFENFCIALPSLQRPKKLRMMLKSAGWMTALLKPKDDLRKDSRFMELCRFLNINFGKLRTKFSIKIFAVTPLNEECGVIEWVERTSSFRSILLKSYKRIGVSVATRDLKEILAMNVSAYDKFTKFFLPKFPPIFMRWFFEKFPSLHHWEMATDVYIGSLATMSMVGYIVGLGDRHGENILFDEASGSCVHVDFNCLFEKGKTFEFPEKVPFRLTQNLVHAFGAAGIKAKFKSSSAEIMNILWESKRSILTNLEAFLHDPLVEWSKSKKLTSSSSDITNNELASKILKIVERKLSGFIELESFSCDGQAEKLIQHATDKKNLSEMYIGWSPFL